MAAVKPKKIRKRAVETVRERTEQTNNAKPKKQRVRSSAKKASTPFRAIGRGVQVVARPFRFLLWPFKVRPVRFIGRLLNKILFIDYFYNAWKEVKQVTWPDRRETRQLTLAVFAFAVVFGLLITVTDYGLDKVFKKVILK